MGEYKAPALHFEKSKIVSPSRLRRRERRLKDTVIQENVEKCEKAEEAVVPSKFIADAEECFPVPTADLIVETSAENIAEENEVDSKEYKSNEISSDVPHIENALEETVKGDNVPSSDEHDQGRIKSFWAPGLRNVLVPPPPRMPDN